MSLLNRHADVLVNPVLGRGGIGASVLTCRCTITNIGRLVPVVVGVMRAVGTGTGR